MFHYSKEVIQCQVNCAPHLSAQGQPQDQLMWQPRFSAQALEQPLRPGTGLNLLVKG